METYAAEKLQKSIVYTLRVRPIAKIYFADIFLSDPPESTKWSLRIRATSNKLSISVIRLLLDLF